MIHIPHIRLPKINQVDWEIIKILIAGIFLSMAIGMVLWILTIGESSKEAILPILILFGESVRLLIDARMKLKTYVLNFNQED